MQRDTRMGAGFLFVLGLLVTHPALAQQAAKAVPVTFEVQIVRGSNQIQPARQDPECDEIRRRLPMSFSTLEMIARKRMQLVFGQVGKLQLPTGRQIEVLPISVVRNHLHVQFQMKGLVNTRLQMRNGVPVIVGGESHEHGQIIVMLKPDFRAYLTERPVPQAPRGPQVHRVNQPR